MNSKTKIFVQVKLKSKQVGVEKISEQEYIVKIKEPPIEGKANKVIIEILAKELRVSKSRINLKSGNKSKQKVFIINYD